MYPSVSVFMCTHLSVHTRAIAVSNKQDYLQVSDASGYKSTRFRPTNTMDTQANIQRDREANFKTTDNIEKNIISTSNAKM